MAKTLQSSWRSEVFSKPKTKGLITRRSLLTGRIFFQKKGGKIVTGNFLKSASPY